MSKTVQTPGGSAPSSARKNYRLRRRWLIGVVLVSPLSVLALWVAVNRVEWLGPMVADALRAVIGKDAVTEIENIAYSVQDRFNRFYRQGEAPKAYWEVPQERSVSAEPKAEEPARDAGLADAVPAQLTVPSFRLEDVGPVHKSWSAPGDGKWLPVKISDLPKLDVHMFKTLLHPDKNRSWAELFVVAIDVGRVDIHLVPGTREPAATVPAAMDIPRPGKIPPQHHSLVLAAFNGGFKTEHGSYGMFSEGVMYVAPKKGVCAVALFTDGHVEVDSWGDIAARQGDMKWWRQTPNCMVEDGSLHPKLKVGLSKKWGATLDGNTVIRRSAVGISADGKTLYVGISNHTTAVAMAEGMRFAGAITVAQLDVNFSYPKFVLFETPEGSDSRLASALADGFEFSEDEYLRKRNLRDFFYLTSRAVH